MSREEWLVLKLYVQSRQITWFAAISLVLILVGWLAMRSIARTTDDERERLSQLMQVATLVPMIVGALVAVSSRSPFGELDDRIENELRSVRTIVFATFAILSSIALWFAGQSNDLGSGGIIMVRNLGMFLGATQVALRFWSPSRAWIPAFAFGGLALFSVRYDQSIPMWALPMRPVDETAPWTATVAVLVPGILLAIPTPFRTGSE
jgi:hypothetical protein